MQRTQMSKLALRWFRLDQNETNLELLTIFLPIFKISSLTPYVYLLLTKEVLNKYLPEEVLTKCWSLIISVHDSDDDVKPLKPPVL